MTSETPADVYLTVEETAAYVGIKSPKTIRRWIESGRLRAFRLGPRMLRVLRSDADGLLKELPATSRAPQVLPGQMNIEEA